MIGDSSSKKTDHHPSRSNKQTEQHRKNNPRWFQASQCWHDTPCAFPYLYFCHTQLYIRSVLIVLHTNTEEQWRPKPLYIKSTEQGKTIPYSLWESFLLRVCSKYQNQEHIPVYYSLGATGSDITGESMSVSPTGISPVAGLVTESDGDTSNSELVISIGATDISFTFPVLSFTASE